MVSEALFPAPRVRLAEVARFPPRPSLPTTQLYGCFVPCEQAYGRNPSLPSLLVDPEFASEIVDRLPAWRRVVALSIQGGITAPGMSTRWGGVCLFAQAHAFSRSY